jgi:hypothetical protein
VTMFLETKINRLLSVENTSKVAGSKP